MIGLRLLAAVTAACFLSPASAAEAPKSGPTSAAQVRKLLGPDARTQRPAEVEAPIVLCIDDKPVARGQPSGAAYAKAAGNGFRSVVTLRMKKDGVDPARERLMVERHKMRYFNFPVTAKLPGFEQVDEFLRLVHDEANHPMLINCAFAERVAPFMMIFRIALQGWSEERALEEAALSGLPREELKKFARGYLSRQKKKPV